MSSYALYVDSTYVSVLSPSRKYSLASSIPWIYPPTPVSSQSLIQPFQRSTMVEARAPPTRPRGSIRVPLKEVMPPSEARKSNSWWLCGPRSTLVSSVPHHLWFLNDQGMCSRSSHFRLKLTRMNAVDIHPAIVARIVDIFYKIIIIKYL